MINDAYAHIGQGHIVPKNGQLHTCLIQFLKIYVQIAFQFSPSFYCVFGQNAKATRFYIYPSRIKNPDKMN